MGWETSPSLRNASFYLLHYTLWGRDVSFYLFILPSTSSTLWGRKGLIHCVATSFHLLHRFRIILAVTYLGSETLPWVGNASFRSETLPSTCYIPSACYIPIDESSIPSTNILYTFTPRVTGTQIMISFFERNECSSIALTKAVTLNICQALKKIGLTLK